MYNNYHQTNDCRTFEDKQKIVKQVVKETVLVDEQFLWIISKVLYKVEDNSIYFPK